MWMRKKGGKSIHSLMLLPSFFLPVVHMNSKSMQPWITCVCVIVWHVMRRSYLECIERNGKKKIREARKEKRGGEEKSSFFTKFGNEWIEYHTQHIKHQLEIFGKYHWIEEREKTKRRKREKGIIWSHLYFIILVVIVNHFYIYLVLFDSYI